MLKGCKVYTYCSCGHHQEIHSRGGSLGLADSGGDIVGRGGRSGEGVF